MKLMFKEIYDLKHLMFDMAKAITEKKSIVIHMSTPSNSVVETEQ